MPPPSELSLETLSPEALRRLVSDLLPRLEALDARVAELDERLETAELANAALQVENQELRDEIARLKNLPRRPSFKPSGMEKATERASRKPGTGPRRRGPKRDKDRVTREEVLTAQAPPGSRFKGYETFLVRELILSAELVRYRRECWLTPAGQRIVAPLPDGVLGGCGANLRRFCLVMHAQGQVTTERLTAILNGIGLEISKRQVVRLLTSGLEDFLTEDQAVLQAGLATAPYVSVDDTGARHARHDNEVRLHLQALAYNLATFLRCIELPEVMADWSLTGLQLKLIKIGARVVRHTRAITFQLAEVAVTGPMVRANLAAIRRLRARPTPPSYA